MLQTFSTDNLNKDIIKNSLPVFTESLEDNIDETLPLPSIKREFLSDNEDEIKKMRSPTPRKER